MHGFEYISYRPNYTYSIRAYTVLFALGLILYLSTVIAPSPVNIQSLISYSFILLSIPLFLIYEKTRNEYVKYAFILLLTLIMLRYLWWRTFNTINTDTIVSTFFSTALYMAEVYSITIALLGIFFSIKPIDRVPINVKRESLPTVDIFIPTYNEPPEIPKITALAALNMDYPQDRFNVYILDDGGTEQKLNDPDPKIREYFRKRAQELKEFVENLRKEGFENIHYLTRKRNVNAKAGNINEALKKTNGDLILILDADHVPTKEFLKETVGFFVENPNVFLVQTPHTFYNPDPIEKNLNIFGRVPGENEMFYFLIQKGFDLWNSAFFCGSAALLRRKFLKEVGGIQTTTITEDAETAMELHSRGYDSVYYDKPMIYGLNPETLSGMIVQRIRWAQGMLQIFVLKNPLFKKGLKWYQKLAYFNASFFWLFGIARTIFLIAPLAYLLFGLHIYDASVKEVLAYPIPHFLASFIIAYFLFSRVRYPLFSEIYESIQGIFLIIPTILTFLKPKDPKFRVTPKGEHLDRDFVSPFYAPFFILFHLILIGFAFAVYRWFAYPDERGTVLITSLWNTFNFSIVTLALYVAYERRQRRQYHRIPANDEIIIYTGNSTLYGNILDISVGGVAVKLITDKQNLVEEIRHSKNLRAMIKDIEGKLFTVKLELVGADINSKVFRFKFAFSKEDRNYIHTLNKIINIVYSPSSRWKIILSRERTYGPLGVFKILTTNIIKDFIHVYRLVLTYAWDKLVSSVRNYNIFRRLPWVPG